jgi:cytochrome bd ubiquinol oxidase subunit I
VRGAPALALRTMPDPGVVLALERVGGALGRSTQPDVLEARQMQALSLAVHIPIVCFGIAFPAMILFVEGLYLRTHDATYKALAKRWSKVALIIFAVGVVTGTILSFEFGLLWPNFMATFGEVFGVAFGLEGISFFLEAIFIAIYVYGWDRLPRRQHFLVGIPIVITGFTGSFNVIGVNGWMNHPEGFDVVDGRVVNPRPFDALLNEHLWHELIHMYIAGYLVAGFIVAGVYAYAWLKGRRDRYHRAGLVVALSFAALAAPVQVVVGDWAGRQVAEDQPVKLAAFEGVTRTEDGAPFTIGGFYDEAEGKVKYGIKIPMLLSLLAHHDPTAEVKGLDTVPPQDRPPVNVVRYAFQTMVGIGTGLALLGTIFLLTWLRKGRLPATPWFYRAVVIAGPAALTALIAGWITTEVGRQPWIVYRVMRSSEAVTSADGLEVGYAVLVAVYLGLAGAVLWLLRRLASRPPQTELSPAQQRELPQAVRT